MAEFDEAYLRMQQFGSAMLNRLDEAKEHIDSVRAGKEPLPENCPNTASLIHTFHLSKIIRDLGEVNAALKQAVAALYAEVDDKNGKADGAELKNVKSAETLIRLEKPIERPHVVILGAGASLAAFPTGDANGRRLPLMVNVVQTLGLTEELIQAGLDPSMDFESLYSQLFASAPTSPLLLRIANRVEEYFGSLQLPDYPTLYDVLLLSLREKDAIFTFNWDPFLADAYTRHFGRVKLPQIFHLHGNVRVGFCNQCKTAGLVQRPCGRCKRQLQRSPLLYPVAQKNYTADPFIASQWLQARDFIQHAFILTIFGYSAPNTDQEALLILTEAWKNVGRDRLIEQIEIIDIRSANELGAQWGPISFHGHYQTHRSLMESRLARYPRRTCEALYSTHFEGLWTSEIAWGSSLEGLRASISELQKHE